MSAEQLEKKRVGVLIPHTQGYPRSIAEGFQRFLRLNTHWSVAWAPQEWSSDLKAIKRRHLDGLVAFVGSREQARDLRRATPNVVNVSHIRKVSGVVTIHSDDLAVGEIVAGYFLEKGFTSFSYLGLPGHAYSLERCSGFVARLQTSGHSCRIIDYCPDDWRWLDKIPRPSAVLACADWVGCRLLQTCVDRGIEVPDELAVVGVDNETPLCELSAVPLSSVQLSGQLVGMRAAELLGRLMDGESLDDSAVLRIPPVQVVERQSSNVGAVGEPRISKAIQFIRDHALRPLEIDEVAQAAGLLRYDLERRFKRLTGRSPYQHVLAVRLNRAKELLVVSDLSIAEIAEKSAFGDLPSFSVFFKKRTGLSPGEYRKQRR